MAADTPRVHPSRTNDGEAGALTDTGIDPEVPRASAEVGDRLSIASVEPSAPSASSRLIGVIVTDIEDPYYARLVHAIETVARADGYGVVLCNVDYDVATVQGFIRGLEGRGVDGVVLSVAKIDLKTSPWFADHRVPVVLVDTSATGVKIAAISSDNRLGGRLAIDHLLRLGHRKIGMIMPPRTVLAARERLAGAQDGMRWAGATDGLSVVVAGRYDLAAGTKAMSALLRQQPDTTAVFAFNDFMAIGAVEAIRRAGMDVPGDISIVGFDDLPIAEYSNPPLTTVRQSVEVMGRWAYRQLRQEIVRRGRQTDASEPPDADWAAFQKAPVELRVRKSTSALHDSVRRREPARLAPQ